MSTDLPMPHTLAAMCERWSYEAREHERRAKLHPKTRERDQGAARAYRECAAQLGRVLNEHEDAAYGYSVPPMPPRSDVPEPDEPDDGRGSE